MMFGYLISKPGPWEIPQIIPYFEGKQNLVKYSTTEGVLCDSDAQKVNSKMKACSVPEVTCSSLKKVQDVLEQQKEKESDLHGPTKSNNFPNRLEQVSISSLH